MTSNLSRSGKRRLWEKHIAQWSASGLSQVEYCRKNRIGLEGLSVLEKKIKMQRFGACPCRSAALQTFDVFRFYRPSHNFVL